MHISLADSESRGFAGGARGSLDSGQFFSGNAQIAAEWRVFDLVLPDLILCNEGDRLKIFQ